MNDTSPEMEAKFREMMMSRSPQERFLMGCEMFETARKLALALLPPGTSEWDKRRFLLKRFYGDEPELVKFVLARMDEDEAAERSAAL